MRLQNASTNDAILDPNNPKADLSISHVSGGDVICHLTEQCLHSAVAPSQMADSALDLAMIVSSFIL